MLQDRIDVLNQGDENGNDTIAKITLATGRVILAFATKNLYAGDWDFGPTWNYFVEAERPFLVDTGRRGMGPRLMEMMDRAGVELADLGFVLLSHGHEDHDGGLFELTQASSLDIKAHETYRLLNRTASIEAPLTHLAHYPASCWRCPMPESFSQKHCVEYHHERATLKTTSVGEGDSGLGAGISVMHVPGHNPDCVALLIDEEVMLTGDTILPEITTHPTTEDCFRFTRSLLPSRYTDAGQLYGLRAYIRSVKRLREISRKHPHLGVLPAHRLFSNAAWNLLDLRARCDELIQHHIDRCAAILAVVDSQPRTPKEIAEEHFEPRLLAGFGIHMAVNEVVSHCELLDHCGDAVWADGRLIATGNRGFESFIRNLV